MDYIIIVAGGKGLRMGGDIPKQFLPIKGKPVLMRTIERFHEYSEALGIILVLPEAQQEYWKSLCKEYDFIVPHQIANGGTTRFHSVQNGLALVPDDATGVVGVHDGVRPFVATEVIKRCYDTAQKTKAVIPVTPVIETLRHIGSDVATINTDGSITGGRNVLRSDYRLVQTPQVFDIQLLKAANTQEYTEAFTDDASVVEAYGHEVVMVDGNRENIKITTPFDVVIAEALLGKA